MKEFLKTLEKDFNTLRIGEEVSVNLEAAEFLKKNPKDTIIMENIHESNMKVVSGICNTREKIARALNTDVAGITQRIMGAINNPMPISDCQSVQDIFSVSKPADLSEIPILTYYSRDGGPYITSGVIIAKDPETDVRNASIHRMLVLGKDRLTARIVPRHLYTYHQRAEALDEPLEVAIAIGMHPATLLATTTSVPITVDELEVANNFHQGEMKLIKCETVDLEVPECEILLEGKMLPHERAEEGPFVDLTDTYDVVRMEPVIELDRMHYRHDSMYHAIMPAGFEHKLLQGLPQEPRIFNAVQNTVPTVKNVALTEGGCCWLHAAISIQKQTQGDGKNVIMAALAAHPSLKHCVVVDEDVNIFNAEDIEYAIATRVKGDEDILIVPGARGSSLDPCAKPDGTTTKMGVDATKPLDKLEKFERVSFSN
ncbi:UbiD family decarboxylase [Methanobacterium formicicum]|uniref:Anhydromevalonate phosphate decarboxylase n=1 Tax=Methanobacterium formicicum (strain DSM 3637 / PP1) TaxID=1204725 RepID=K2RVP4_METFP|nr:UbiD family decarboxylase [Methanobacterium formicicum]EKF86820.1 UbiD family decarboxylase [Methanobacterium formicicum DSM 3637]